MLDALGNACWYAGLIAPPIAFIVVLFVSSRAVPHRIAAGLLIAGALGCALLYFSFLVSFRDGIASPDAPPRSPLHPSASLGDVLLDFAPWGFACGVVAATGWLLLRFAPLEDDL